MYLRLNDIFQGSLRENETGLGHRKLQPDGNPVLGIRTVWTRSSKIRRDGTGPPRPFPSSRDDPMRIRSRFLWDSAAQHRSVPYGTEQKNMGYIMLYCTCYESSVDCTYHRCVNECRAVVVGRTSDAVIKNNNKARD